MTLSNEIYDVSHILSKTLQNLILSSAPVDEDKIRQKLRNAFHPMVDGWSDNYGPYVARFRTYTKDVNNRETRIACSPLLEEDCLSAKDILSS